MSDMAAKPNPALSESRAVSRVEPQAQPFALRSPIAQLLDKPAARAAIEPLLRPGESFERIIVEVFHAAANNPKLKECAPASLVTAVAKAVSTGLIIGEGVHLVPFGEKCTAVIDYKGAVELIVRSGVARHIDAHCVYANEPFVVTQGTNPTIEHRPILDPKARGAMIGAYAFARLARGGFMSVTLSTDEIDAVRQHYSKQWKQGALPYWYAQKTCVKRLAKLLPKNPALAQTLALFAAEEGDEMEEALGGLNAVNTPAQIASGEPVTSHADTPTASSPTGAGDDEIARDDARFDDSSLFG